jgi:hypothetical protein
MFDHLGISNKQSWDWQLPQAQCRCVVTGTAGARKLHHVGHCRDASLFNCLVLCARCHQAEHARRRNTRPA